MCAQCISLKGVAWNKVKCFSTFLLEPTSVCERGDLTVLRSAKGNKSLSRSALWFVIPSGVCLLPLKQAGLEN